MLEILRCKHCGRLAVALNEIRITNHKCAGQWEVVQRESFDANSLRRAPAVDEEV
jgi:hypothetical protein